MTPMERPRTAPAERGRGMLSHPGALSWMYNQPEVEAKRGKDWLRSLGTSEMKLRVALKRPLEREKPSEKKTGMSYRTRQVDRMNKIIIEASKSLPPDAALLAAGRKRLDRIRSLPVDFVNEDIRRIQALSEMADVRAEIAAQEKEEEEQRRRAHRLRAVPKFAKFCDCGTKFAEDAYTCRSCGSLRKEIEDPLADNIAFHRERASQDEATAALLGGAHIAASNRRQDSLVGGSFVTQQQQDQATANLLGMAPAGSDSSVAQQQQATTRLLGAAPIVRDSYHMSDIHR